MRPEADDPVSSLMRQHREALRHALPASLDLRPPRRFALTGASALAIAACVLISALSFQLGRLSDRGLTDSTITEEVVSGHVRSLMAAHLFDVRSTDQHTVKPWFEGKLDFGPVVKDFVDKGFALVGGRLDYVGGRVVVALVYQHGQHFINVFEWPAQDASDSAPRLSTDRGFQLYSWQKNGLAFWVVSDVNGADLQVLAMALDEG